LKETGIHPQAILLREGTESFAWPNANEYIPIVIDSLGIQLFGEDVMNIEWDYNYYQPWSDNEWLVDKMLAMLDKDVMMQ